MLDKCPKMSFAVNSKKNHLCFILGKYGSDLLGQNYFLTDKNYIFVLTDYELIAATVIITFMCEKLFFA